MVFWKKKIDNENNVCFYILDKTIFSILIKSCLKSIKKIYFQLRMQDFLL